MATKKKPEQYDMPVEIKNLLDTQHEKIAQQASQIVYWKNQSAELKKQLAELNKWKQWASKRMTQSDFKD